MGIFNFFRKSNNYEQIETPKIYKFNQIQQLRNENNSDGFRLNFNFNAIHNSESEVSLVLINTSDISDIKNLYSVQLDIKKDKTKGGFENKLLLSQGLNPNDRGGLTLARHLHKVYNWNTDGKYLRGLKTTIDFERSKNLELDSFLNKEIILFVTDGVGQELYVVKLDWKSKRASISIKKAQIDTFMNVYFTKYEPMMGVTNDEQGVKKVITVKGFDKSGEPEIHVLTDGAIRIVFEFMPPLNGKDDQDNDPIFDNFDKNLSNAIGKDVEWDDREVFIVPNPGKGDEMKIKKYLQEFWKK